MNKLPKGVVSFLEYVEEVLAVNEMSLILQKEDCFSVYDDCICVGTGNREVAEWVFEVAYLFTLTECEATSKQVIVTKMKQLVNEYDLPLTSEDIEEKVMEVNGVWYHDRIG